ncbi:MAG: hypothetical protein ACK5AZ_19830 [Bryobacteraceae bacterium]
MSVCRLHFRSCIFLVSLASAFLFGCSDPGASRCIEEALPEGALPTGKGGVRVLATPDDSYSVHDADGRQLESAAANKLIDLAPGRYLLKINHATHPVTVRAGRLLTCSTGFLVVNADSDANFYVLDEAGAPLALSRLGRPLALFEGPYQVRLNNTSTPVQVTAGVTAEVQAGLLTVQGATGQIFYVHEPGGRQLGYTKLNEALALLPGAYEVRLNGSVWPAQVRATETTWIESGTLVVKGEAPGEFAVHATEGRQVAAAPLSSPLALFPGSWIVKVNNSAAEAPLQPSETVELATGILLVQGEAGRSFPVLDAAGAEIAVSESGAPLALLPGRYTLKSGSDSRTVTINAGAVTRFRP